jgi:hypothetical protein
MFHSLLSLPSVKIAPIRKKSVSSYTIRNLQVYCSKSYAFIYEKSDSRITAVFRNIVVLITNNDENENKLLFILAQKPDWNENKDINYSIITSESTIQKVREICNNLYKLSNSDDNKKPTILVGVNTVAYVMTYPEVAYYRLVKSSEGALWKQDGKIDLSKREGKKKINRKRSEEGVKYVIGKHRKYIGNRYYVVVDSKMEPDAYGYEVYDTFYVYDLYKRHIIETSTIRYPDFDKPFVYKPFDKIQALQNVIFVIEGKTIVRPVIFSNEGGPDTKIKVEIPEDNKNEKMIEISISFSIGEYPILLLFSKSNAVVVGTYKIYSYDFNQSRQKTYESDTFFYPKSFMEIDRVKLHRYGNFFTVFDGIHLITIYYNKIDSKYYTKHAIFSGFNLHEFEVIGYILLPDESDCIGVVIASQKHDMIVASYDVTRKEIYFSNIIKYNYIGASKRGMYSLICAALKEMKGKRFVLRLLISSKLLGNIMDSTQKEEQNQLNITIGTDINAIKEDKSSYFSLSLGEIYKLNNCNYVLTYEQPCLVKGGLLNRK